MKLIDLTGQKFGNWTVLHRSDNVNKKGTYWRCKCSCPTEIERDVCAESLRKGTSLGCGHCNAGIKLRKQNKYDLSGDYGIGYTSNTNVPFYFDKEDYSLINDYCWYEEADRGYCVAFSRCAEGPQTIQLHRLIMDAPHDMVVDHINHDKMDNRKINLRVVTKQQNNMNRKAKGVYYLQSKNKWRCHIMIDGKVHSRYFDSYSEAIKCRKEFELYYFGEFAYENALNKTMAEREMISLEIIDDIDAFCRIVECCKGDVYLCDENCFERYNIKSKLLRFIKFNELCKDHQNKYKVFCMNKADENYMLEFFRDIKQQ